MPNAANDDRFATQLKLLGALLTVCRIACSYVGRDSRRPATIALWL